MNDDQLKRDIEEALCAEPSPQFAAGVRARIAEHPRSSSVWIRWGIPAAGFATAAFFAAVLLVEPQDAVVPEPVKIVRSVPKPAVLPIPRPQRPVPVQRAVQPSPQTAAEPEVLIDPREVAAFRRFIEGVQEERIDLAKLIELQKAAAVPAPIQEIALMPIEDLAPIVIESLTFGPRRVEGGSL